MIKSLSAAILGATVVLAGCNTMSGMGDDIKSGGQKLGEKAREMRGSSSSDSTANDPAAQPTETMTQDHQHMGTSTDGATMQDSTTSTDSMSSGSSSNESMMDRAKSKAKELTR